MIYCLIYTQVNKNASASIIIYNKKRLFYTLKICELTLQALVHLSVCIMFSKYDVQTIIFPLVFELKKNYMPKYLMGIHSFRRQVLGFHEVEGIENVGGLRWENVLCLLAVYLICYFSLFKGISASGKV